MDKRIYNSGTIGNKGGKGSSLKDKIWHKERWEQNTTVQELEDKIRTGVYSVRDVYLLKALKADRVILKNMADKVLATLHDVRGADGEPLMSLPDEDRALISAALNYAALGKRKQKDTDE